MRTLRLTTPPVRRWAHDYPALTTLVALLLVCLIPFFQYRAWVIEGLRLGNIAFEEGWIAFENGDFLQASRHFDEALAGYRRPWFLDQPEKYTTEFYLAQSYLLLSREQFGSFYLGTAGELYRDLLSSPEYHLAGLAGLTALRPLMPPTLVRRESNNPADRYSAEALAKEPDNQELRAEAAKYYYFLSYTYALLRERHNSEQAIYQALALSPQTMDLQIIGDVKDDQGAPIANGAVRVFNKQVGTTDQAGHFDIPIKTLLVDQLLIEIDTQDGLVYGGAVLNIVSSKQTYTMNITAAKISINELYKRADRLARSGDTAGAATIFAQAVQLAVKTDDANLNNQICWTGSIDRMAKIVLPACERAVELAPTDYKIRDSRGLGRALTGDYQGAIEDFSYFVQFSLRSDRVAQRQAWIAKLEVGRNPFDAQTLQLIHDQ
jgi:hypothetical protein